METRIYVACLASYNRGVLFGQWIDLQEMEDVDVLREEIKEMLKLSPTDGAEEWRVDDSEGLPRSLRGEWPDLDQLMEYAENVGSVDDPEAYKACCENQHSVCDVNEFMEVFMGHYESETDFAEEFYEERGENLGVLESYIDWERVWHGEFDCAGFWTERTDAGVYVFSA